jgi:hypothetical protein
MVDQQAPKFHWIELSPSHYAPLLSNHPHLEMRMHLKWFWSVIYKINSKIITKRLCSHLSLTPPTSFTINLLMDWFKYMLSMLKFFRMFRSYIGYHIYR